jgi:hypothetical protein
MYSAALKQAAQIIAAQRAQSAQLKSMTPAERQAYATGAKAKRLALQQAAKRKATQAAAARTALAAQGRRPGAVAAGRALGRSTARTGSPGAADAPTGYAPAASSVVQARLVQYLKRP